MIDHYIGDEILLPRGGQIARGHVVECCHVANGNVMGRAHANPILDTRMCQIEFAGIKFTELTANIVVESMYAQCDTDQNEYLLFNLLVDYCKESNAISLTILK